MASALFTLADGAAAAVAVGGTAQPVGLNVTAGNVVNGQNSDMVGVTGYMVRSIWNNQNLNDAAIAFTINQTTGAWSFTPATTEGAAYIVEVTILQYTTTPSVSRSYVGVYLSAAGSYRVSFPSTAQSPAQLIALLSAGATLPAGAPNEAFMTNAATTNGQGVGGPTIIALVQLVCRASGIFDWAVSAAQPAAAAGEVVTWTVTTQTGAAAVALTGNTASGIGGQVGSAAAGTGIIITTGGGGELTLASVPSTVGTAAVGDKYTNGGLAHNAAGTVLTPFTRGNNVFLLLKITNSATNRVASSITMRLTERLFG